MYNLFTRQNTCSNMRKGLYMDKFKDLYTLLYIAESANMNITLFKNDSEERVGKFQLSHISENEITIYTDSAQISIPIVEGFVYNITYDNDRYVLSTSMQSGEKIKLIFSKFSIDICPH